MIYLLTIFLSLVVSAQCFASEVTAGNITHLKNGRQPDAGAAIFPAIPVCQLLAIGVALIQALVPRYAVWIIASLFLVFSLFWVFSFLRLRAEFRSLKS
jgi:hypothetical protein